MARKLTGPADDGLKPVNISDFSGGLNTQDGPLSLASNQTPMCQNVIGFPGRLLYPGGVTQKSTLPTGYKADQAYEFYDAGGGVHQMVWANGNLYDCATGTYSLIRASVYTAGQVVGVTDDNGIMYYCTTTVPLRQYNGTTEKAVPNAGGAGVVPPPAGTVLTSYCGSLVIGNPTIIDSGSFYYPGAFMTSNVNDPTTWVALNINQLGEGNFIQFLITMGVSDIGVVPSGTIMVGTTRNIFAYRGPVTSLAQTIVNCPVGCADGGSVVYIPAADLFGSICFLGSDYQFWRTNGITAQCISMKILNLALGLAKNAQLLTTTQRFFGSYNERYQYYICDFGSNQQLAYRWPTDAWFYFQGQPSGVLIQGTAANGYPCNYSASNGSIYPAGLYTMNVDQEDYFGSFPNMFYTTPYLHAGDPTLWKEWQWVELSTLNNFNTYQVQGKSLPRADNTVLTSSPLQLSNPAPSPAGSSTGEWNVSLWDQALWGGGVNPYQSQLYVSQGMLSVPTPETIWGPASTQPLRSSAASFTISVNGPGEGYAAFDIAGFIARYNPRGRKPVGGQLYAAQSGATQSGTNPFVGVTSQSD